MFKCVESVKEHKKCFNSMGKVNKNVRRFIKCVRRVIKSVRTVHKGLKYTIE